MKISKNSAVSTGVGILISGMFTTWSLLAQADLPSEGPRLSPRIEQEDIENMSLLEIREAGRRIFSTPFNLKDGLGDGPLDPSEDPTEIGGRPTLQGNGIFLRLNGIDSQSCLECHSVLSNATIPATFAVGGVGGVSDSAFPGTINPDIDDDGDDGSSADDGHANIGGRMINPPFSFGAGGVEALAKEMTAELQTLKALAKTNPGASIPLLTKGVNFGTISFIDGSFNTDGIEGINKDLVVRPFGRKGCCFSIRDFDRGATQFHHGMQPQEVVGDGIDADGDGVADELTIGEMSALHIFQVALEKPVKRSRGNRRQKKFGKSIFKQIGCASCHIPKLVAESKFLPVAFPEDALNPNANVFMHIDLSAKSPGFKRKGRGVEVALFSDLKKHDMGPGLVESTGHPDAALFITARLWGVADTAPYLHDGRAVTLSQAIELHGGEAQTARNNFSSLSIGKQEAVLAYLRTLRTPKNPNSDFK